VDRARSHRYHETVQQAGFESVVLALAAKTKMPVASALADGHLLPGEVGAPTAQPARSLDATADFGASTAGFAGSATPFLPGSLSVQSQLLDRAKWAPMANGDWLEFLEN